MIKLKINDEELTYAIEGSRKVYEIPSYQRHYSWGKTEWDRLIEDVNNISKYGNQTHFMGTIVYIDNTENNYRIFTVIDGQQRLITLSLLLKALADVMHQKGSDHFRSEIGYINTLLIDNLNSYEGYQYKIKPGIRDIEDYRNIFEKENFTNKSSKVFNAYYHFFKKFSDYSAMEIKQFYDNVSKLKAVWIGIEDNDGNPQSIFETINSSGVALTFPDLIRNYILLQETSQDQNNLYKRHWLPFEDLLNNKMDSFIRSFLIMKREAVFPRKDSYMVFKDFYNEERKKNSTSIILSEMIDYAHIYMALNEGFKNTDKKGYEVFEIFGDLNYELSYPFLMRLIYEQKFNLRLDEGDMLEILSILSSYMFRKTVASVNLTGMFANWIATLFSKITHDKNIKENFINEITSLSGKRLAFVTDKEFRSSLLEAEVYNTKYKKYILKTLESSQSKEKINFDNLTVDHIIPQTLDAYWTLKVSYDPNSRNEYSRILHTLGNLTLTGYNSEKGNTDRDVYSNSNLALNREINLKSFNLESVKIRTENLTELALNIWYSPNLLLPDTDNSTPLIEVNFFDLVIEDYEEPPKKLHIGSRNYNISEWHELFDLLSKEYSEYFSGTKLKGTINQKFNITMDILDSLDQDEVIKLEF